MSTTKQNTSENKTSGGNPQNGEGTSTNLISIGINIGAQNTIYSSFSKVNTKSFISQVLLSDVASRVIPSILVYTDDHRLYGETAKASMKRFFDSTYINLSRLIGFNPECEFYLREFGEDKDKKYPKYSYLGRPLKNHSKKLTGKFQGYVDKPITKGKNQQNHADEGNEKNYEEVSADIILSDFLSLLHDFYFKQQNLNYDVITLSIPDYFTIYQKERMKTILETIHKGKKVFVTTESTAITMYYGYTKYRDMFIRGKIGVDQLIKKNIVFIDIGYSKTSFIFSTFNYKEFKIKKVKCLPFLGGRNLDFIILKKLMDKFTKKTEVIESMKKKRINNILDPKSTYRLLESIEKTRKALTVNKDAMITVDSLYDEIDLEDEIKKEEFEQDIKVEFLDIFKKELELFLKDIRQSDVIDDIEMCGELVRTPILQDIVKKLSKLEISKKY